MSKAKLVDSATVEDTDGIEWGAATASSEDASASADDLSSKQKKQKRKGALRKEAEQYREKLKKRGVIYISRIPPFMKPNKMRTIFEEYGEVTRIYLAEEGERPFPTEFCTVSMKEYSANITGASISYR